MYNPSDTLNEQFNKIKGHFMHIFCSKICFEVDGGWSPWSHFSPCTVSCGEGTMSRERFCNNPRPAHNGNSCVGDNKETSHCHDRECPSKYFRPCHATFVILLTVQQYFFIFKGIGISIPSLFVSKLSKHIIRD